METILGVLMQIIDITAEMSPYLLLGFLIAGLMHAFIPSTMFTRYLAGGSFSSVLYAALFGVPLPLCSCGVIPTAMSLRKEGASKGAVVSFLIATPQTGVDSIAATYSLMGLPFAIVRPIAALFTALFGGQLVNVANKREQTNKTNREGEHASESLVSDRASVGGESQVSGNNRVVDKLKAALEYAFVEMMQDIGKWLLVGLIVAGLITALVPDSFFAIFRGNTLLSMLLVLAIAIPMYICATGSIPIAVALMMKGLTPGAALVMLMAGPACNFASILVVNKVLGRKTLAVYVSSIIVGSIAFGYVVDYLLPAQWFVPTLSSAACCHGEEGLSWFNILCTLFLGIMLLNAFRLRFSHPHCHCHDSHCEDVVCDAPAMRKEFVVKGMNCSHCAAAALKALKKIPGVTAADVDLATGRAFVEGETEIEKVAKALDSLGFTLVQV